MKKILVVDDEASIRLLYQEELEEEGYEVKLASNGREALTILESYVPDLVLLDIMMPEMDGIETLNHIREKYRNLTVILCTAYTEYKQDLGTWSSDGYVVKSSNLDELKGMIRKIFAAKAESAPTS